MIPLPLGAIASDAVGAVVALSGPSAAAAGPWSTALTPTCSKRKITGKLRNQKGTHEMKILFIIATDDGETIYNAMRLANVGVEKGDEVSVFMLGKGVLFEGSASEQFDVMGQMSKFRGDFYV
jgi:uncharacterized protein involved in oxidation of intracellular sulfur